MTTKAYLGQAIRYERMIANKLNEIQRFREMATSITVQDAGDRVQTSSSKDRMGTMVTKLVDLESEVADLNRQRDKIIRQIENLDDSDSYQILYSRYIDGIDTYNIKNIIHCSKTQVYRLFDKALEEFEQKYGKSYAKI